MQLTDQANTKPSQTLILQIIVGSMAVGLLVFAIVAAFVRQSDAANMPPAENMQFLVYMGLAGVFASLFVPGFVSSIVVSQGLRAIGASGAMGDEAAASPDEASEDEAIEQRLRPLLQVKTIVEAAITEAGGMLAVVAFMLTGNQLCLVGAGLIVAVLIMRVPTRTRIDNWLDAQRAALDETRTYGS